MIVSISSSLPTFKTVRFKAGLNLLVVRTHPESGAGQTRNSAGKTSLLEIIHFLCGANIDDDSLFSSEALRGATFSGEFQIDGLSIKAERAVEEPSKIYLGGEVDEELDERIHTERKSGRLYFSNSAWKDYLGQKWFGFPRHMSGSEYELPGSPSFRSLFSYFARRRNAGGFFKPEKHSEKQQRGDYQVNLSYLLDLDWRLSLEFEKVRKREKSVAELKKATGQGLLGEVLPSVGELRAKLAVLEQRAAVLERRVASFRVHESYKELTREAAKLRADMQSQSEVVLRLRDHEEALRRSLESETEVAGADVHAMYAAAGVQLPHVALKRYEDVRRFFDSIIANRRHHLESQLAEIRQRIADIDRSVNGLDLRRATILQELRGQGALDDFNVLHREYAEATSQAFTTREQLKAAELLEGEGVRLEIDRKSLRERLQRDLSERREIIGHSTWVVSQCIGQLYDDRTGLLVVEATDNGPEFRVSIEGDRGGGIASMEIFCFDLMLFVQATRRFGASRFLVHDSHLYDGVDSRQVAKAISLARQRAVELNGQYVAFLNSDIYEGLGIDFSADILDVDLTDESETGGLFGFRFD